MDPTNPEGTMLDAVNTGIAEAAETPEDREAKEREKNEVKKLWKEYEEARKFDCTARAQYAIDRRYAAGTANLNWAVTANLIGAFIDILVSFLYARNPDVSIKKAPRVDNRGTTDDDDFAKTLELVVSSLWRRPTTRLKQMIRRAVRSTLTTGTGWWKVILMSNGTNIPEMRTQLNDLRQNLQDLEAERVKYADPTYESERTQEQVDADLQRYQQLAKTLETKLEVAIRKALVVDFVASEDMQVSLDVRELTDYTNAGWVANAIYRPKDRACAMFPRLTKKDVDTATCYYQRSKRDYQPLNETVLLQGISDAAESQALDAEQYVTNQGEGGGSADERGPAFVKVVELWNRDTGHVHTMIDGIDRWAKEPYQPDYPSTRFYPYFMTAFYEVDGARHPQSLVWRLMKLQDEYASVRSNLRLTRQRATPGTLFNAAGLGPDEIAKIQKSVQQEFTGIKPTDPDTPLRDLFAPKPVEVGDARLFDPTPIMSDMERISGVQEALQQSVATPKTATEAEIQQSGFASRTTADRDVLETVLTDMAQYTAELSLTGLSVEDAQRIAGMHAFWPEGMAIDDLLTMVEVEIEAGTTGKPRSAGDKEAWGVVLPVLKEMQALIQQAQLMGNLPLAEAMSELLRETMTRMGDDIDPDRFIPQMPQAPGMPGAPGASPMAPAGAMPGAPGALPPQGPEGAAPGDPAALVPPELMPGGMAPPVLEPPIQ